MDKGIFIYDIETLINCFTYSAINRDTNEIKQFVIWKEQNDFDKLLKHLKEDVRGQVGFNNNSFDYPVLHYILSNINQFKELSGEEIANLLYEKVQSIIKQQWSAIYENEVLIPQLDLFRIHHFDNKARITSLKKLEINMDMDDVQDMPYSHDTEITTQEQVDKILSYNLYDVKATLKFYELTKDKISLRASLQKQYDLPCLNYPDSKIGEQLMLQLFCENTGQPTEKIRKLRTRRKIFKFIEFIPDYIKFQTKEFNGLLEYLRGIEVKELKDSFKYEFEYNELIYHFGTGGIHACTKSGIYESDNKNIIISCDVSSLYPSLAVNHNLYPKHLGEQFSQIYEHSILIPRLKAKKEGNKILADSFKLALNAIYGKSNSEYSFLYDPNYTLATTLAGQLVLSMLAEMLLINIPNIKILQINTDGLDAIIDIQHKRLYWEICKQWKKRTRLTLEYVVYSKMIIRDVNSYIAVELKDGKIKYKGALRPKEIAIKEGEWHKNFSQDVVTQAVNKYFLENIPVEKTIKEHTKIYDFCKLYNASHGWSCETLSVKQVQKNYEATKLFYKNKGWIEKEKDFFVPPQNGDIKNVKIVSINDKVTEIQYNIEPQQKTNRYYISNKGKTFRKTKDDRIISIEASVLVTIFNKYEEKPMENYDICYDYYYLEAYKIIHTIDGTAERLENERKEKMELDKLKREEENFIKYILKKIPTERQYLIYKRDWLIDKYGEPEEIKSSKPKQNLEVS